MSADNGNCEEMFDSGLYVFVMRLRTPDWISVGALGRIFFPEGWYLYTGSARRGLRKRVERHWAVKKNIRWHMDYLSTAMDSEPVGAVVVPRDPDLGECLLNQRVGRLIGGEAIAPGFGASDCHAGCPAHLWFSFEPVSLLTVARVHPQAAVLMPGAGVLEQDLVQLAGLDEAPDAGDPPDRGDP